MVLGSRLAILGDVKNAARIVTVAREWELASSRPAPRALADATHASPNQVLCSFPCSENASECESCEDGFGHEGGNSGAPCVPCMHERCEACW